MTPLESLEQIRPLVDMKYRHQQTSFARLVIQENKIRAALQQLDQHLATSKTEVDVSQKGIGADVAWQAWVGRKKRELNIQLAQILAVKERHIAQVRAAYGRVITAEALFSDLKKEEAQKRQQVALNRAITANLFSPST